MGTIPTIYSRIDGFSLCHSSDRPVREHVEQTQAAHVAYQHGEVDEPRDADGEMICVLEDGRYSIKEEVQTTVSECHIQENAEDDGRGGGHLERAHESIHEDLVLGQRRRIGVHVAALQLRTAPPPQAAQQTA